VAISAAPTGALAADATPTLTFTFSEDPGDSFVLGDIDVRGGTLGNFQKGVNTASGQFTYTAVFTRQVGAAVSSVNVASGKFKDAAGNDNVDGADVSNTVVLQYNALPVGGVSITGNATQGQILTADTSTLRDADGLGSFSYLWKADGVPIDGVRAAASLWRKAKSARLSRWKWATPTVVAPWKP